MADLGKLVEEIKGLTLIEASELVKMLEQQLGVSAAAPVAVAVAAGPAAAAAPQVEEQTEFSILLKDVGPKKIQVIKVVRQLTTLGLKEAKDVVDGAPSTILEHVAKDVAEDAKAKLEAEGATVEMK